MGNKPETKETLRALYAKFTGCDLEEVEDGSDFFEMGGDSVGVLRMTNQALQEGLSEMTVPALYENPALADLAAWYDAQGKDDQTGGHESNDNHQGTPTNERVQQEGQIQKTDGHTSKKNDSSVDSSTGESIVAHWKLVQDCISQTGISPDVIMDIYPSFPRQLIYLAIMFDTTFEVKAGTEDKLIAAMERLHAEDPMLRTRLFEHNGTLQQVVLREKVEWSRESGKLEEYHICNRRHGMKLGQPLSRYGIVREGDKVHVVWTLCHAITDRLSRSSLIEQVIQYWKDPSSSSVVGSPIKALIERNNDSKYKEAGTRFWKERLQGLKRYDAIHAIDSKAKAGNIAFKELYIDAPASTLKGIAQSTLCHVAWALSLAKMTALTDIFFMTLCSGRQIPGMDLGRTSGFLARSAPFRVAMTDRSTPMRDFLQGVQKTFVSGFAHENFADAALFEIHGLKQRPTQSLFNYTTEDNSGISYYEKDGEGGGQEKLKTTMSGFVGWAEPPPSIYIAMQPVGNKKKLQMIHDQKLVPTETATSLLEDLKSSILRLNEAAPWEGKTIGDFWPETPQPQEAISRDNKKPAYLQTPHKVPQTLCNLFPTDTNVISMIVPTAKSEISFGQSRIQRCIQHFRVQLKDANLPPKSAVIMALGNTPEFVVSFLGITWSRFVAAPINPALKEQEIDFYVEDIDAQLVIIPKGGFDAGGAAVASAKKRGIAIAECSFDGYEIVLDIKVPCKENEQPAEMEDAQEDDIALILHTSGTTGRPKAVPLTHKNLYVSAGNVCHTYALDTDDRTMLIMPLYHIHGIVASFLSTLLSGGTIILPPRLSPTFWTTFTSCKATWYTASPTMHHLILTYDMPSPKGGKSLLRFIRSCSSALSPALFQRLEDKFKCPVLESYAMTEASHLMASNPLPPAKHFPGAVGLPQGIDLEIRKEGKKVEQGATGEVCIRGANVTKGYLNNPEANKSSFYEDGFFRTGDEGKLDEDGYLTLTGRLKEFINKGGEKISPVELDNVISQHEEVEEVVCFAMDDEIYGQDVGAAVRSKPGAEKIDVAKLRKWIAERLTAQKVPKKIWVLDEIPKTATGKVQRKMVAEKVAKM